MSNDWKVSDRAYRIIDSIYRLHRGLLEIESSLSRIALLQVRMTRITHNGRMATLVAGLFGLLPILISLGKIEWTSAPAVTIYCLGGAVVLLWIYQWKSAEKAERELATLEGYSPTDALEDRHDFMLEETNAYAARHRLVDGIIRELRTAELDEQDGDIKDDLRRRRERYQEIQQDCAKKVSGLIQASSQLVVKGKRTKEEHDELLDWAAAIPEFDGIAGR